MFITDIGKIKLGGIDMITHVDDLDAPRSAVVVTDKYMAPEVSEEQRCLKSDVWSLGISLIEIADRNTAYDRLTPFQVGVERDADE